MLAGGLLCFTGFIGLSASLFTLSPFLAVLNVYLFAFGAALLALEQKEQVFGKKYLVYLRTEALFLTRPYGRAFFYVFLGVLVVVAGGMLNFLIGAFTTLVGLVMYRSSKQAFLALHKMKEEKLNELEVAALFQAYDGDKTGSLDSAELAKLCQKLGSPLNHNELEAALFILDKDGSGTVSYPEFLAWWTGKE